MVAVVLVTVVTRAVTVSRWSWYADDFGWMDWVDDYSFGEYVFQVYNGHLMPGQFLITWLITTLDPLNFTWVVIVVCLFAAASVIAWGLALRELFGERPHLLVALVVLGMTPTMTGVSLWWSTAINAYSIHTSMGLTVYFLARWFRRGHQRRDRTLATLAYLGGLLFWEKALLVTVPALFVVLLLAEGPWRARLRMAVRTLWPVSVVTVAYTAGYLVASSGLTTGTPPQAPEARSPGHILDFISQGLAHLALPSLVGGPFSGLDRPDMVYPESPLVQWLLLVLLGVAVAALGVRFRKGAWLALAMSAVYVGLSWSLIIFNQRHGPFGSDLARVNRYWVDSLPVALLTLMFLTTPTAGRHSVESLRRPLDPATRRRAHVALTQALAAVVALTAVTSVNDWARVAPSSPKPWTDTLVDDARAAGTATIADVVGPPEVVGYFVFGNDGNISTLLSTLNLPLTYDVPTEQFLLVADDGHLVAAEVTPNVTSLPGPDEACGYPVDAGSSVEVALTGELFEFGWFLRLSYFTESNATLRISGDDEHVDVEVTPGPPGGELAVRYLKVTSAISSIRIEGLTGDNTVCVSGVDVGQLAPERPEGAAG